MKFLSKAKITAIGAYLPKKKLSNADFEKMIDTTEEWIITRTGIKTRYITAENEFASDIAVKAVENLKETNDVNLDDVDMIIVPTFTPDFYTPSTAAIVQGKLGLSHAGVLDINAACAGFVHGLLLANSLITVGQCKKVLVIASEVMSKVTDYTDRTTCVLFGDGAGAFLVEYDEENPSFLSYHTGANGELGSSLYCTGISQSWDGTPLERIRQIYQDGRGVYNYVIKNVPDAVKQLLDKIAMPLSDINWFVPHSANMRMIQSISDKIGISIEKTLVSVVDYGNTSSATIPLAIWDAVNQKKVKKGDTLLLYGFGGGLNHAGAIIKWQY